MTSNSRDIQVISNELFINSKVPEEAKCELLSEMKKHFTTEDQLFFVNSFYTYLNYHPTEDFIINLSDVYKWLGFSRLDPAKRILNLVKEMTIDFRSTDRWSENRRIEVVTILKIL
jgi:type IV secretory pathway VirB4 component